MATTLYGLASCDTTRAARTWLAEQGIAARFHDVRADGLAAAQLKRWAKAVGWERLVNKASTTWRGLPEAEKAGLDETRALALLEAHPTLLKRPVLEGDGGDIRVGFKASDWAADRAPSGGSKSGGSARQAVKKQ